MKKSLFLNLLLFVVGNNVTFASANLNLQPTQVIESKNIEDILKHVTPNTLVVFDIDNTLAAPEGVLGSDQWFSHMVEQKKAEGFDYTHAVNSSLPIYYLVAFNIDLQLLDNKSLYVLEKLKEMNAKSMCLTARSLYVAERTLEQLKKINLDFNPPSEEEKVLTLAHTSLFKKGCLFSGLNDKGEALFAYLDSLGLRPDNIIFIDDKHSNIKTVELAVLNRQIPFTGIHYTFVEDRLKSYNHAEAEEELSKFLKARA